MVRLLLVIAFAVGTFAVAMPRASEAQGLSAEEEQYRGRVLTLNSMMMASFERAGALTENPRFYDLDWQNDFLRETSVWKAINLEAQEIEPSDRFRKSHDAVLEAFALMNQAALETRLAIETLNPNGLASAAVSITLAGEKLSEAGDLLPEID